MYLLKVQPKSIFYLRLQQWHIFLPTAKSTPLAILKFGLSGWTSWSRNSRLTKTWWRTRWKTSKDENWIVPCSSYICQCFPAAHLYRYIFLHTFDIHVDYPWDQIRVKGLHDMRQDSVGPEKSHLPLIGFLKI